MKETTTKEKYYIFFLFIICNYGKDLFSFRCHNNMHFFYLFIERNELHKSLNDAHFNNCIISFVFIFYFITLLMLYKGARGYNFKFN